MKRSAPLLIALCALSCFSTGLQAGEKKTVVMIAGKPSHGPGAHEHNAGVQLLAKCLREGAAEQVDVKVHLNGEWPHADELRKADTLLVYADGFTGHPLLQGDHLSEVREAAERGCGFMAIHWATEVPKEKGGAEFLDWMGGFCEPFWSVNPHWKAEFTEMPPHPIASGVQPFSTLDEWYFHMRFRPGMQGVTPILTALPPEVTVQRPDGMRSSNPDVRKAVADKVPQHVAWAAERPGGGRGFGFTGGHFHKGWANDNQRKLVLNAILWTAKAPVPKDGVVSRVTEQDLAANLDPKTPPRPIAAPQAPAAPQPAGASTQKSPADANPLLTPTQAIERMTVPKGFQVDLIAAEPALVQPIAFCWDARGRLWVVEGNTYPTRRGNAPTPRADEDPQLEQLSEEESASLFGGDDRILIFSDEDGDGTYETRKVFMEHLNLISGIEVGYGGVYLGAAPFFVHVPLDAAGDRPAGPPRVLADGFGWQDTHETLNSFVWGPDGWLYGCHGVFTQSKVRNRTGAAGGAPRERKPMNCAYWRWHPVRSEFEIFAQGTSNPWGLDYNARGQLFSEACVIPHFWHVIQGAYYLRQSNPIGHFNPFVYKNIETIADHAHFVGRQNERNSPGDAGGGHAHCGLAFYDGTLFPPEYRDRPYLGNIHGKRINSEKVLPAGSGYRASHGPDFLKANDFNFTAVTIKTAPDGSLVLSDWYDRQKCHSRQTEIWDRSNGRLYRVRSEGWKPWKFSADLWNPASTLELQLQENGWLSRMARKAVGEYRAKAALPAELLGRADELLARSGSAEERLRLMWWLHATGDKDNSARWLRLLRDSDADVRRWAVQLAMEQGNPSGEFFGEMKRLCREDPSPVVRLGLCSALQRLPHDQRWDLLEGLLQHEEDERDQNIPQMLWYATEPMVPANPERALALARSSKLGVPAGLISRRVGEMRTPEALDLLLQAVREAASPRAAVTFLEAVLEALKGRSHVPAPSSWAAVYAACERWIVGGKEEAVSLADARAALGALFDDPAASRDLRALVARSESPIERRQRALRSLAAAGDPSLAETLEPLLGDAAMRLEALRNAASLDAAAFKPEGGGVAFLQKVLGVFQTLSAEEKGAAVSAMAGRVDGARLLLNALLEKRVSRADIPVFAARQIAGLNDPGVAELLEKAWGIVRLGDADAQAKNAGAEHARLKAILSNAFLNGADLSAGRVLFQSVCGHCHQLFGEGGRIGPDLTGSNRANLDYLLENVINPNAVIGKDYELQVWTLKGGRVVSGMIRQESDVAFTVQTVAGEEQVPKEAVESVQKPGISMMPVGLFSGLSKEQLRDLLGYLRSPGQVASPGTGAPKAERSYAVEGVLEGESLRVLSKGRPAAVQRMNRFLEGMWSGDFQLFWRGGAVGEVLELALPVAKSGRYRIKAVLTRARDYGTVRFLLDHKVVGGSVDLFGSKVTNTEELTLAEVELREGEHVLGVEILGANPAAVPSYMFGLDYLRLEPLP